MVEGTGEGSDLKRELEEGAMKREAGAGGIPANWREVPLGEKTAAGTERLKGGIWEEVIQGETLGIGEATRGISEATRGIPGVGSGEEG